MGNLEFAVKMAIVESEDHDDYRSDYFLDALEADGYTVVPIKPTQYMHSKVYTNKALEGASPLAIYAAYVEAAIEERARAQLKCAKCGALLAEGREDGDFIIYTALQDAVLGQQVTCANCTPREKE